MKQSEFFWKKHKDLKSSWSGESRLTQRIMITMLEELETLNEKIEQKNSKIKIKRKPSEWSLFAGQYLKEGKTMQDASKAWKQKQERTKGAGKE